MADLSKANIYFAIGVPFENAWLGKIADSNPDMRVIHTERGDIAKLSMKAHHHHHDDQGRRSIMKVNTPKPINDHEKGEAPRARPPIRKAITSMPGLIPTSGCHLRW
jgi:ABC-type Zn uptake system ZnuABC Zn-binding protein ZnuA